MFRSLKDKLKSFTTKASKELEDLEEGKDNGKVKEEKGEKKKKAKKEKPPKKSKGEKRAKKPVADEEDMFAEKRTGKKLRDGKLDDLLWDLEMALLESDVALPVVEKIKSSVKDDLLGRKVRRGVDLGSAVEASLKHAIAEVLAQNPVNFDAFIKSHEKPVILMFVGVNGTGKTTVIAKIAHRLQKGRISCVMAAADTFRAGAIEQLQRHSEKLGVKLIKHQAGADPAAVAYDAIEHAKARHKDVVLVDTAGRMHSNINLMDEMKKIKRIAPPHMIIFVGDALSGNDTVIQAQKFDETVGIDCAVLTKIDADAKGGAALSIAYAVGKPIAFVGIGQEYDDLVTFNPKWMVNRLFGEDT
ncbi:MAG: signal recognition particle-docking protein FtsY [Methanomassiliicoccales archaeon]|nr:MAG: signal recognition particle-docking protein FtsY [Methanomassiliicoccales archaeon]